MTKSKRFQIQAAGISFLCRVPGIRVRGRARKSDIWRELRVELLLIQIERKQLRWFGIGHLVQMPLAGVCPTGRRPKGRSRTCWRDYIALLGWEGLVSPRRS